MHDGFGRRSWHIALTLVGIVANLGMWLAEAPPSAAADVSPAPYSSCPSFDAFWTAVNGIPNGDSATFTFAPGLNCVYNAATGDMQMTRALSIPAGVNITIKGNGLTLDGSPSFDVIDVNDDSSNSSTLELDQVTATGGANGIVDNSDAATIELDGQNGDTISFVHQFQYGSFNGKPGYQLSINTRNLQPGQWTLKFRIAGASTVYSWTFSVE